MVFLKNISAWRLTEDGFKFWIFSVVSLLPEFLLVGGKKKEKKKVEMKH